MSDVILIGDLSKRERKKLYRFYANYAVAESRQGVVDKHTRARCGRRVNGSDWSDASDSVSDSGSVKVKSADCHCTSPLVIDSHLASHVTSVFCSSGPDRRDYLTPCILFTLTMNCYVSMTKGLPCWLYESTTPAP
ncbi:hypothetical protein J6590_042073 [Homalodisca vitripennis]|nr:hypothetical protein J6590_042073 [Homalodisca vitripennis]